MITPTDQYITTPIEPSDESSGEHLMGGFKRNPVRSLVKKTFQFCVSVRTITIFILLISVITIALIVWGLGFRGAQQTVTSLVNVLRNEAMERAMSNFDNFFTQSEDIVESATAQYWANFQDLQYVEDDNNTVTAIKGFLYSTLLPNTRYINSLNWIRKDGAMISFSYEAGAKPYEYTYSYSSTRYGYVKGFFDPSYPSQPFEQTITSITAFRNQTQRIPTYAVAVQKAPEKGMFSELSPHASDPWISVSSIAKPYRKRSDGSLIGTVNAVFYLQSIKQMVVDVNPTDYGFVVVMQDDGKIVGDSTPFLAHTNGPCGTNNTTILKLCKLINNTGDSNFALGIARFRSGVFEASGVKLRVVKETITRGLLNWHVFIGLSNDEFEGPVQKFSRTAIWVTAIITVAAMLVGALVLFVLLNSLNQMAKCFTYIQKLELDSKLIRNTLERNSIVYEVRALESNFKSMVSAMKSFQKYIPRAVVADLVHHQKEAKLGLIKTNCTVFFMDIADFTTISEQLSPEVLVEVMCEVFNMASRTIVENGGVIDKVCVLMMFMCVCVCVCVSNELDIHYWGIQCKQLLLNAAILTTILSCLSVCTCVRACVRVYICISCRTL